MCRLTVRDGFWVLLAVLWCVDESNLLPLFLTAALVHEAGHAAVLYLAGGHLTQLTLTACGAVMQAALPCGRFACAAVSLAGPAAGFALTIAANAGGYWRLAGASALLSLFNLLPLPPLDGGMALAYLLGGGFSRVRGILAALSGTGLLLGGLFCLRHGGGCWLLLVGAAVCISALRTKKRGEICIF